MNKMEDFLEELLQYQEPEALQQWLRKVRPQERAALCLQRTLRFSCEASELPSGEPSWGLF